MLGLLFNKVAGPRTWNVIKKRPQHRCAPVNNTKFLRTAFLKKTSDGCFYAWYVFIIHLKQISHIAQVMFWLTSTWSLSWSLTFLHFSCLPYLGEGIPQP